MRLAERVAGRLDVDRMLDELAPEQYREWQAYRQIEADPFELLIELLKHGFAAVCQVLGADVEPEYFELRADRRKKEDASPEKAARILAGRIGPPKKPEGTPRGSDR